jgi:cytochrome P450
MSTAEIAASSSRATAPGPRGLPFLGVAPHMKRDPLAFMRDTFARYGDIVALRLGPQRAMLVTSPEAAHQVLLDGGKTFGLSPPYEKLKPAIGGGLTVSEGAAWRRRRGIAQQAMSPRSVQALIATFVGCAEELAGEWRASKAPVDAAEAMFRLTVTAMFRSMFGQDLRPGPEVLDDFATMSRELGRRFFSTLPWLEHLPTSGNRAFAAAKARLDRLVYQLIAARSDEDDASDLLGRLLQAAKAEGRARLTSEEIHDEIFTFALAGHETTASTLTWFWLAMASEQDVARKVEAEVAAWHAAGPEWSLEGLGRLTYTRAVLDEVLRLFAPAWLLSRSAKVDTQVSGYDCPQGSLVIISPFLLHRHPRYWDDPERFDPERFLDPQRRGRAKPAYLPFGLGPRACVGSQFALAESLATIATVVQSCRMTGGSLRDTAFEPVVILRPKGRIMLCVEGI